MPTPDDLLAHLAAADYLYYRTLKAAQSGRRSAQMIAAINALESKLATRGSISFDTPSTNIFTAARAAKTANADANKDLAKDKLDAFLKAKALPLKEELEFLARYLVAKGPPGTKWIAGPLKKLDKALTKTEEDYDYAWTMNKDLIRGTLVTQTAKLLDLI